MFADKLFVKIRLFIKCNYVSSVDIIHKWNKCWHWLSDCSIEVKNFLLMELSTWNFSVTKEAVKAFNNWTAVSNLTIRKEKRESGWQKALLPLKLEIRMVLTATPPTKTFCKIYWQIKIDICQKANFQFVQILFFLRRITRGFSTKLT